MICPHCHRDEYKENPFSKWAKTYFVICYLLSLFLLYNHVGLYYQRAEKSYNEKDEQSYQVMRQGVNILTFATSPISAPFNVLVYGLHYVDQLNIE